MGVMTQYTTICILKLGGGYRKQDLPLARTFFEQQFPPGNGHQGQEIQQTLLDQFKDPNFPDITQAANAGLCLRCYVSPYIVNACKKIASRLIGNGSVTYQDLLALVLTDDGKRLIIIDTDTGEQIILNHGEKTESSQFNFFTVEVIQSYNYKHQSQKSLSSWTYLKTQQNQELKKFLLENGFNCTTDWAILNKATLNKVTTKERPFLQVYHDVYRRDLLEKRKGKTSKKCPDPSNHQLEEMYDLLIKQGVKIQRTGAVLAELKQIAQELRGIPIFESIDDEDNPIIIDYPEIDEDQELISLLKDKFDQIMQQSIKQGIDDHIEGIKQRPRYRKFSDKIILGLKLFYEEGMAQEDMAEPLGMTNKTQVSRVLDLRSLISKNRQITKEKMIQEIINLVHYFSDKISNNPDFLDSLIKPVEIFIDEKIFNEAISELNRPNTDGRNSEFAQYIKHYLKSQDQSG
jgi:hypothetical protein